MTEKQYKDLMIATIKMSQHEEKNQIISLLKIVTVSFQKDFAFTYHLPDHREEYIIISIIPEKMPDLKKYEEYLDKVCAEVYPTNDKYEYWGLVIKPGILPADAEDVSQEIHFEHIQAEIIEEIRNAKYVIWIAMAWFTNASIYAELLKKKKQGLDIVIIIDDNDRNRNNVPFVLEDNFETYRIEIKSQYKNIMHDKFCIIDLKTVLHGTFNWTVAANYNKETVSIDRNRETAESFANEFLKLKRIAIRQ
ncbi:MAG: phospholipase D-like domain-containing protein [Lachnospiraceae bacterium]|nr:phospholipase D-like domain-containing protein [Lachnospiraceae bacterium]